MIRSALDLTSGTTLHADLCIVGAGAAGITIAREFLNTSKKVLLLESGGLGFDVGTQDLYGGESEGTPPARRKNYLLGSRLRFFGGSTNHWEGYCRPLDEVDFLPRTSGVHSGWPFPRSTITPWFKRAAELLQIQNFREVESAPSPSDLALIPPHSPFDLRFFYFSPPTRFGMAYREELNQSSNVEVLTMANVTAVKLNPEGTAVSHLAVKTLSGLSFTVQAKQFVLGLGGIENARLLLLSNDIQKNGVGNQHDLVGRYFMEHPQFPAGHLILQGMGESIQGLKRRKSPSLKHDIRAVITGKPELLEREKLNNFSIQIDETATPLDALPAPVAATARYLQAQEGAAQPQVVRLYVRMEQIPHRESRITLSTERDALGQQRSHLAWKLTEHEHRTGHEVLKLLARELGEHGVGRVIAPEGEAPWRRLEVSSHHLGTTRMAVDPKEGVVDLECRVHGVQNLFVAGSSVFPTGGYANPTFTLTTLALRLSDHLKQQLS